MAVSHVGFLIRGCGLLKPRDGRYFGNKRGALASIVHAGFHHFGGGVREVVTDGSGEVGGRFDRNLSSVLSAPARRVFFGTRAFGFGFGEDRRTIPLGNMVRIEMENCKIWRKEIPLSESVSEIWFTGNSTTSEVSDFEKAKREFLELTARGVEWISVTVFRPSVDPLSEGLVDVFRTFAPTAVL